MEGRGVAEVTLCRFYHWAMTKLWLLSNNLAVMSGYEWLGYLTARYSQPATFAYKPIVA